MLRGERSILLRNPWDIRSPVVYPHRLGSASLSKENDVGLRSRTVWAECSIREAQNSMKRTVFSRSGDREIVSVGNLVRSFYPERRIGQHYIELRTIRRLINGIAELPALESKRNRWSDHRAGSPVLSCRLLSCQFSMRPSLMHSHSAFRSRRASIRYSLERGMPSCFADFCLLPLFNLSTSWTWRWITASSVRTPAASSCRESSTLGFCGREPCALANDPLALSDFDVVGLHERSQGR